MMTMRIIIWIWISFACLSHVKSQEIRGLIFNQRVNDAVLTRNVNQSYNTLDASTSFPFFDDFSTYGSDVLPDTSLWSDSYAFINSSFPDSAISIGVATLDAIDDQGYVYAIGSNAVSSDTLTSKSMDITGVSGDTIYLSFFYQAGGKGDEPESTDTLLVDFCAGSDTAWINVWKTFGDTSAPFKQVIIPVDTSFVSEQFRFRFRNYTSVSTNDIVGGNGALSNVDQWHIDYVQLKQAGSQESLSEINDLAFVEPLLPTLVLYNTMPWTHLSNSLGNGRRTTNPLIFRTFFPDRGSTLTVNRTHMTINVLTGELIKVIGGPAGYENEEPPVNLSRYYDNFTSDVQYNEEYDYGEFEIISYLMTDDVEQFRGNDTLKRKEIFQDYYAYDDGTAEYGFGITGESAYGAEVACRFKIYRNAASPDTLVAVDFYFNKVKNEFTDDLEFQLCVWDNDKGMPGELLYQYDTTYTPDYSKSIHQFTRIPLKTKLVVSDTIFVGFIQLTDEFINVGYDINLNSRPNIFVSTDALWYNPVNSLPPGSLMIRPVFWSTNPSISGIKEYEHTTFKLYPNPAMNFIRISHEGIQNKENLSAEITDCLGRRVLYTGNIPEQIDVSSLSPGLYFVVISENGRPLTTLKFIKAH